MNIEEIHIEVTRQCNLSCSHCCRGNAQDFNLSLDVIDSFFDSVDIVGVIGFTGGEPLLVPDVLMSILDSAKKHKTIIYGFQVVTNGTIVNQDVIDSLLAWYNYCESNLASRIFISKDEYHPQQESLLLKELEKVELKALVQLRGLDVVFAEGNFWNKSFPKIVEIPLDIIDNFIVGDFFMNCKGDLLSGVDWSYSSQEDHKICNIKDTDILQKIVNWNK